MQLKAFRQMKMIDQDQVGKALKVSESFDEFLPQVDLTSNPLCADRLNRGPANRLKG